MTLFEQEVLDLGRECVVWITGDPNDAADVQTPTQGLAAIREAIHLGQERNDEANRLRLERII